MRDAIDTQFYSSRRGGQIAAQIAVFLPLLGIVWWYADYFRLRYGNTAPLAVGLLVGKGVDANQRDALGRTALLIALDHNSCSEELWNCLIAAGADPDLPDQYGRTARKKRAHLP